MGILISWVEAEPEFIVFRVEAFMHLFYTRIQREILS